MTETELGVVVSSRDWAERLHRFTTDHGGARVRARIMQPEDALDEEYHVLFVDDITSFLNQRLVQSVQSSGRKVIGVFDNETGPEGHRRLADLGVDEIIEASASPDEFLRLIGSLHIAFGEEIFDSGPIPPTVTAAVTESHGGVTVVGAASGGAGATELALALAAAAQGSGASRPLLVDADNVVPSIAQRLGLALHPNLRTAVDALLHRTDRLSDSVLTPRLAQVDVMGGLSNPSDWIEVREGDVVDLVREMANHHTNVIVNISSSIEDLSYYGGPGRFGLARALLGVADHVVVAAQPTPVGVARLLEWVADARTLAQHRPIHMVINRAPKSSYERGELTQEITRTYSPRSLIFAPTDHRLASAAWAGEFVSSGPFMKAIGPLASSVIDDGTRKRPRAGVRV